MPSFTFPPVQTMRFVVLGTGGTGGYLIRDLARQISVLNTTVYADSPIQLCIVDADTVEPKNVARQNFLSSDVGKSKAAVLAARYGAAYGLQIESLPAYVTDSSHLTHLLAYDRSCLNVIVGCVDNHATRALIAKFYATFTASPLAWIDAGNEEYTGQVVFALRTASAKLYPTVADVFPDVLTPTDKLPTDLSCADHAQANPQSIATNMFAANLLFMFCNILMSRKLPDIAYVLFDTMIPSVVPILRSKVTLRF